MKKRFTILSVIAAAALTSSAHAQIISADFAETLTLGADTNSIVASGELTAYTLSENPVSSGATVTNPANLQGSVDFTLSSSGLITLTDNSASQQFYNGLSFTLSNIQFSNGQTIVGINQTGIGAIQADGSTSLQFSQSITPNSVTLNYSGEGGSGLLTINGGRPSTTFQLTIVPEPRDWALMVLLGVAGLVVVRKLRERFPAFSFASFAN